MNTEAMKLALEALSLYARTLAPTETQKKGMEAITALDEALAQPQQKPVAWMHEWEDGEKIPMLKGRDDRNQDKPKTVRPLVYGDTSPQPAQPQQEPIETYIHEFTKHPHPGDFGIPKGHWWQAKNYAEQICASQPPQRKPLTDEEVEKVWRSVQANDFHDCVKPFARAIEAAHGIKGEA